MDIRQTDRERERETQQQHTTTLERPAMPYAPQSITSYDFACHDHPEAIADSARNEHRERAISKA